jgi:membrane protein implicated in regulation of membrane protease activity
MSYEPLKEGDKVVMHTCGEGAGKNDGRIWTVMIDEFKPKNQDINVVFLDGMCGYFSVKYLQKVNL